mmetsp:Transcript_15425/g.39120  ORF Transcript_15425/g.39120 Transcript_15425/m.39120 type:complete len:237 (-) Transcript_15425:106-816(-)
MCAGDVAQGGRVHFGRARLDGPAVGPASGGCARVARLAQQLAAGGLLRPRGAHLRHGDERRERARSAALRHAFVRKGALHHLPSAGPARRLPPPLLLQRREDDSAPVHLRLDRADRRLRRQPAGDVPWACKLGRADARGSLHARWAVHPLGLGGRHGASLARRDRPRGGRVAGAQRADHGGALEPDGHARRDRVHRLAPLPLDPDATGRGRLVSPLRNARCCWCCNMVLMAESFAR